MLPPEGGKRRVALTLRIESGERRGPFIDPAHGRRLVYDVSLPLRASGRRIPAFRTSERVFADTKRTKEKVGPKVPLRRSFDIESLGAYSLSSSAQCRRFSPPSPLREAADCILSRKPVFPFCRRCRTAHTPRTDCKKNVPLRGRFPLCPYGGCLGMSPFSLLSGAWADRGSALGLRRKRFISRCRCNGILLRAPPLCRECCVRPRSDCRPSCRAARSMQASGTASTR